MAHLLCLHKCSMLVNLSMFCWDCQCRTVEYPQDVCATRHLPYQIPTGQSGSLDQPRLGMFAGSFSRLTMDRLAGAAGCSV